MEAIDKKEGTTELSLDGELTKALHAIDMHLFQGLCCDDFVVAGWPCSTSKTRTVCALFAAK